MRSNGTRIGAMAGALLAAAALGCGSSGGETAANTPDAGDGGGPPPPAGVVAAGVRWAGRVDTTDAAHPRFSWSGTGFVAHFTGTSLTAQLAVTGTSTIFKAVIDQMPQATFTAPVGQGTFPLAMGLAAGDHTVELYRQTEGAQGQTQLMGLTVGDGMLLDPPAGPGRLIEVIGDSISAGFGNLGALTDTDCFSTESHWDTYGAVAARALGAEVSTIAASGRGVVRNYNVGDTVNTMPMIYDRTLTNLTAPSWDFHIEPQAVVINLGTNDISNGKGDPGVDFQNTYVTLLETVRGHYPDAWIVGIIAPLLTGNDLLTIRNYIKAAVDARIAAGDQKVEFFGDIAPQTSDKFACAYHPNAAENMLMADQLAAELRPRLGW